MKIWKRYSEINQNLSGYFTAHIWLDLKDFKVLESASLLKCDESSCMARILVQIDPSFLV